MIYDRYGQVFGKIFIQNREQVPSDQISPYLVDAVISEEDNRFTHSGVDFYGIFRALIKNTQAGRIRQGASTVTQELARNVFDLRDRTYDRKILEVFLAMRIERFVPKNKIMELYLNRVYFGGGLYGAEAAAKGYFGKPAKELSVGEAAMLAALLKSPNNCLPGIIKRPRLRKGISSSAGWSRSTRLLNKSLMRRSNSRSRYSRRAAWCRSLTRSI